jgi:anti-sigma factor RsiW
MQTSSDSQCYFVQLQIDSFLDGELVLAQQEVFMGHVHSCQACAKELHFARNLYDAVMDLPLVDCSDLTLEPVHRISQLERQPKPTPARAPAGFWQPINDWLSATPLSLRLALPALALTVVVISMSGELLQTEVPLPNQQAGNAAVDSYSAEQIQKALQDLNLAIEYLNDVSQRTEVMIGERFVVTPLQESLNASFDRPRLNRRNEGSRGLRNDPI